MWLLKIKIRKNPVVTDVQIKYHFGKSNEDKILVIEDAQKDIIFDN